MPSGLRWEVADMWSERRVATMIPASDLERAKKWYADTLDLKPSDEDPSGVQYRMGDGTEFWVFPLSSPAPTRPR
jgi:catechol 2,3-dioxygenase-like lactoylglutathione lyase family enzyme